MRTWQPYPLGLDGHLRPNQYGTFEHTGDAEMPVCQQAGNIQFLTGRKANPVIAGHKVNGCLAQLPAGY
jgi:hypothetical protein